MSLLDAFFSLFSGSRDTESAKKRLLRQTAKALSSNKYARFYKVKTEEAEPALQKFFYDVYKIISPAQVFLQNAAKSAQLKQAVIDAFMEKNMAEARDRLTPESIDERAKTVPTKELSRQLQEDLALIVAGFDNARIQRVDECYNTVQAFIQFATFDYFFLLKKFDANITERNFAYHPKFDHIRAEYIGEDIKDFLEISYALDPDQDWKTTLKILKTYKGDMDVVSPDQWNKLLLLLRDIRKSAILELMIRHIDKNPVWQPMPRIPDEHIVDPWLSVKKEEIAETVRKIVDDKRSAQIGELARKVFGSTEVIRLKHYTDRGNEIFLKKNMEGFSQTTGLNYLKAFLLDFFKKDIRELCDLLLIRGQWSSSVLSQQLSEGFHRIMAVSEQIIVFDEALADNGENGSRLKAAVVKADRDKSQAKYVRLILKTVNKEAQEMINGVSQALVSMGKSFKSVLEDNQKNPRELIINWKELEAASETPLVQRITTIYQKMYYFVQMMQFFVRPIEEE
jgi:hypothetical protein